MDDQIMRIEERLAHQELAIGELTDQLLQQRHSLQQVTAEIARMKQLLADLAPSPLHDGNEPPPPHY